MNHICQYSKCRIIFYRPKRRVYKYCSVLCANRALNQGQHQINAVKSRWRKVWGDIIATTVRKCTTRDSSVILPIKGVDTRHQAHYEQHKIQPVVFIGENKMDFLAGNVIKYVSRYNLKNGVEDLEKAKHYLEMLIQRERGEGIKP